MGKTNEDIEEYLGLQYPLNESDLYAAMQVAHEDEREKMNVEE